jgi:hypothetical protein
MHPAFSEAMIRDNKHALEQNLRSAYLRRPREDARPPEPVLLRLCRVGDDEALARLARLDSRPPLSGRCVLAEVDGEIVAARPLGPGEPIADPFRRTAHLLPLLDVRAQQLAEPEPRRSRRFAIRQALRAWSERV